MRTLDVAVVIVTYKCAQLTVNCLASIAAERATSALRVTAIVVDNASGDLDAIAKAIEANNWSSWITLIEAPNNGGFGYGNNLAIERAYADRAPAYFYFLNPDTEIRLGAIGSLVLFLETHADAGIAGSSIENPDGSDWPIAFRFPNLLGEISNGLQFGLVTKLLRRWEVAQRMPKLSQPIDWVSGASMMIRPAVIAAIGGFDENYFLYFEETDFCFRARLAGFATWYVPESRIMHIEGQSTKIKEQTTAPRRLPSYWFESRRRYFSVNLGIGNAIGIDTISILAHSLGWLKRVLLRRTQTTVPHLIRDLLRYSVLWRKNRNFPPFRGFRPRS
jgi:N-acetylglucosaminyl-diphospho-decaprenol L-rhamnosyltransferase